MLPQSRVLLCQPAPLCFGCGPQVEPSPVVTPEDVAVLMSHVEVCGLPAPYPHYLPCAAPLAWSRSGATMLPTLPARNLSDCLPDACLLACLPACLRF
jgi:hypothetical protein